MISLRVELSPTGRTVHRPRAYAAIRLALLAALPLLASPVAATEVRVMISGGFSGAYEALVPDFEKASGHKAVTIRGPSMGETAEAIPNRLSRGEPADLLIMVGSALDSLIAKGHAVGETRVVLARSGIGMAVRAGAPHPDISSIDALKRTLLNAKSIAYSDSASGVYLSTVLFPRLGIAEQLRGKSRMIPRNPVGGVVARGEAEIGFQQVSELKQVRGIELVGPLPPGAQKITEFCGAITVKAKEPGAARELLRFLASPSAAGAIAASGMEPGGGPAAVSTPPAGTNADRRPNSPADGGLRR